MSQNTTTPLLALNGQIIPLKRLSVSVKLTIKDKDASGKSSSTATSEQGVKAKELQISGLIPFTQPEALTRLFVWLKPEPLTVHNRFTASPTWMPKRSI
ncbi:nucleoid DNA-binding protein [Shigella flexneri 1485-80]|uniref:baseplate complex protein n=1 Tax=Shigella flexneri TaxID=623 RepID=UPI0002832CEA|nr:hypothetical protein [Shigella flexneri]EJZ67237.1 nucleoid DNA-binding protein [Shigella flexneri 1485-80]